MGDHAIRALFVAAGVAASPVAWALPWNIDMVDSDAIKAYEQVMRPLPEGTMSQPNMLTPISFRRAYVRETPRASVRPPPSTLRTCGKARP